MTTMSGNSGGRAPRRSSAILKRARAQLGTELKGEEKALGEEQALTERTLNERLISLPNTPHPSVPEGKSEADNVVVGEFGMKPDLPSDALPHWELCSSKFLGL